MLSSEWGETERGGESLSERIPTLIKIKDKVLRRNFFTQRVVNLWNSLPSEAVEAPSLNILKKKIDSFLKNKGIKGYGVRAGKWSSVHERSAMISLNGGAGSRGQMAYSCS